MFSFPYNIETLSIFAKGIIIDILNNETSSGTLIIHETFLFFQINS